MSGDRINNDRFLVYNSNTNVLAGSETWTLSAGGTLNGNSDQSITGGQWNLTTGNPQGSNLANASANSGLNSLAFTNSGSLQIDPGTPANTSIGQATSSLGMINYGSSTANLVQVGGLNFNRARGNRDSVETVQAGDQIGRSVFIPYSNGAYQTANAAQYRVNVESTYVANDVIVPMSHNFVAVSNVANVATFKVTSFYGNGLASFPGNITASNANITGTANISGNANVGNIGTSTAIITTGNITTGNVANLFLTQFQETVAANANTSTSITPNVAASTIFNFTANANFTFNSLTSAVGGSSATVIITQDVTGNRLLTSTMLFVGGSKTLSTAASAKDIISVFYDGTTYFASLTKAYA